MVCDHFGDGAGSRPRWCRAWPSTGVDTRKSLFHRGFDPVRETVSGCSLLGRCPSLPSFQVGAIGQGKSGVRLLATRYDCPLFV